VVDPCGLVSQQGSVDAIVGPHCRVPKSAYELALGIKNLKANSFSEIPSDEIAGGTTVIEDETGVPPNSNHLEYIDSIV
jgi:hypothetical protein